MFGDGQFLQNLVELVRYHAPVIDAQRTAFAGVCAVVLGGLITLYGARLTRLVVVLLLAGGGAAVGWRMGTTLGVAPPVTAVVAAVVAALVAGLLYRLWAAVLSAAMLVMVALSVYGARVAWPQIEAFEATLTGGNAEQIELVSDAQQQSNLNPELRERLGRFWGFLKQQHPAVEQEGGLVIAAAGGAGLLMGLMLPRLAMTLWLSLVGVAMTASGVLTLLGCYRPAWLAQIAAREQVAGLVVGGVWVVVLLWHLQRGLTGTKNEPQPDPAAAKS